MNDDLTQDALLSAVPTVRGYKVLEPCVIDSRLGEGGMGAVYRAKHLNLDLPVAVKCMKTGLAAMEAEFVARFQREARVAAEINHPNLIRVYDVNEKYGIHYLVMEYILGETLRGRVRRAGGPLDIDVAVTAILGAAEGLAAAHKRGIYHRDIKPDNVLIATDGAVKVADLGLAKATESFDTLQTSTNRVMGTPQYMPPEQFDDASKVGAPGDVYALAATLYYLLVGKNAISQGSLTQVMRKVCLEDFPSIDAHCQNIPGELSSVITKATAKDPKERYADAGEMAAALRSFLDGRSGPVDLADPEGIDGTIHREVDRLPSDVLADIKEALSTGALEGDDRTIEYVPTSVGGPAGTGALRAGGAEAATSATIQGPTGQHAGPAPKRRWGWIIALLLVLGGGAAAGWFALRPEDAATRWKQIKGYRNDSPVFLSACEEFLEKRSDYSDDPDTFRIAAEELAATYAEVIEACEKDGNPSEGYRIAGEESRFWKTQDGMRGHADKAKKTRDRLQAQIERLGSPTVEPVGRDGFVSRSIVAVRGRVDYPHAQKLVVEGSALAAPAPVAIGKDGAFEHQLAVDGDGVHWLTVASVDPNGIKSVGERITFEVDSAAPLLPGPIAVSTASGGADRSLEWGHIEESLSEVTVWIHSAVTLSGPIAGRDAERADLSGLRVVARVRDIEIPGDVDVSHKVWRVRMQQPVDGCHDVVITVTDPAGNVAEETVRLHVDAHPPKIVTASEREALVNEATYSFVLTIEDDVGLGPVTVNGVVDEGFRPNEPQRVTRQLDEGLNAIVIEASDLAGHLTEERFEVRVDTTPPAVTLVHPEALTGPVAPGQDFRIRYEDESPGTVHFGGKTISFEGRGEKAVAFDLTEGKKERLPFWAVDEAKNRSEEKVAVYEVMMACPACSGTAKCAACDGDSKVTQPCATCRGQGNITISCATCNGLGGPACTRCKGTGSLTQACRPCRGAGRIPCSVRSCQNGKIKERCLACNGRGHTTVLGQRIPCIKCVMGLVDQTCKACRGQGTIPCGTCRGARQSTEPCSSCSGSGIRGNCKACEGSKTVFAPCSVCSSEGQVDRDCPSCEEGKCRACSGSGYKR